MNKVKDIAVQHLDHFPNNSTIIFLHDSLGCIQLWRDFPEKLCEATKCNAIVYDRQGYGDSCAMENSFRDNLYMEREADLLVRYMDEWGISKAILFGHSDGGSIAVIAAGKYPDRIEAIITEGAHVFVEDITTQGIKEAIYLYQSTNLKGKLEKYHGDKTEEMFWAWARTWTTKEFRSWNIEHFLPFISCPSLIIQGEQDEYGSLKQVDEIVKATSFPAKQLILPNVKHTPHKEVCQVVIDSVVSFLNTNFV